MVVTLKFETDSKMHIEAAKEFIGNIFLSEIIVIPERSIIRLLYGLCETF